MAILSQPGRPVRVQIPDAGTVMLLGLRGREAVNELFRFSLRIVTPLGQPLLFEKVVGQNINVEWDLPTGGSRHLNGIAAALEELDPDGDFNHYRLKLVPRLWAATRTRNTRIFHEQDTPSIVRSVLDGLTPRQHLRLELTGSYIQRDYCVQYAESDFNFLSRLLQDEGISYYFEQVPARDDDPAEHVLVLTDDNKRFPGLPALVENMSYDCHSEPRDDRPRVHQWRKRQQLCSGKYTLQDYAFEMPTHNLRVERKIQQQVAVGQVSHGLELGGNETWEVFEYPGEYVKHFDGVDLAGNERSHVLQEIFEEDQRVVGVRQEQQSMAAVRIRGASNCQHFAAGHRFKLQNHATAAGEYLLTSVEHRLTLPSPRGGDETQPEYRQKFRSLPIELPCRPQRVTPKPSVRGTQTAVVVGPGELFVDRFGRVKVKFHWDRRADTTHHQTCWARVGQIWAGKRWGAFFWPRVGHEVIVAFENGDPDQPVIVGSVYNGKNMPPLPLPEAASACGIKSSSLGGDPHEQFNCVVFHDRQGDEHLQMHSASSEVYTAKDARYIRTPGPTFEVTGSLPLLGAGIGGGELPPETELGSPAAPAAPDQADHPGLPERYVPTVNRSSGDGPTGSGEGGGLLDWAAAIGTIESLEGGSKFSKFMAGLLPGKVGLTMGKYLSSVMLGSTYKHVFLGSDSKILVDISGLTKAAAGKVWGGGGSAVAALGVGLSGGNDLVIGDKSGLTYCGEKLDATRGVKSLKVEGGGYGIPGLDSTAVGALTLVTVGLAAAGDIAMTVYLRGNSGSISDEHNLTGPTQWMLMLSTSLAERSQALLVALESKFAFVKAQKKVAEAQAAKTKAAADLLLKFPILAKDAVQVQLDGVPERLAEIATETKSQLADTMQKLAKLRVDHRAEGSYCLNAENIDIISREGDTDTQLTLSVEKGSMVMGASESFLASSDDVTLAAYTTLDLYAPKIDVSTAYLGSRVQLDDEFVLAQSHKTGAMLELAGKGVGTAKLSVGGGKGPSALEMSGTATTLQFAKACQIELGAAGITLKAGGTSSIKITPAGVEIQGLSVKSNADLMTEINSTVEKLVGKAMVEYQAPLQKK